MNNLNKILFTGALILISSVYLFLSLDSQNQCGINFTVEHKSLVDSLSVNTRLRLKNERSVNETDLCRMPLASLQKSLVKLDEPKPDHPGEAQAFRYSQQLSEDGKLNTANWVLAQQQVKAMRHLVKNGAGITTSTWEGIGPGNIGGRVRSIAFDPDDSTRIYAGSVSGGVWLTENAGEFWAPLDDFMANLSVSTLIFDPNNSNVIYAGTGEGTFNADNIRGLGIFKSTDKGQTWSSLANTQDNDDFYWVNRLTILSDSSRLVAATYTGIWNSVDGGVNWTQAYTNRIYDVDVDPVDNNKLVAGGRGVALYSIDGGLNWVVATGLESISTSSRIEIAYSESTPNIVFASIDNNSGEVWKSMDGGQTYSLSNTGNRYLGSQGWYDNALWVDPFNADHLIVGGLDLWRSTDGGVNFTKISTWWMAPNSAHADHHFIIAHPGYDGVSNKQVYFANDGGVYVTPDIEVALDNVGWQELNNRLAITQFYGMGVSPDGTVVGGTQDNGTLIYKGNSEAWTTTFGGDGGYSASDPTDSNYIYGEYVYLNIHRSTNGGSDSSYIYDDKITAGANFIAPFILDPNNENRLLGGAAELWVSDDVKAATPSWNSLKTVSGGSSPISAIAVAPGNSDIIYVGHNDGSLYKTINGTSATPVWTDIATIDLPQRYLMRIAIDPKNTQKIYVSFSGYNLDNFWQSADGGISWNDASGTGVTSIPSAPIRAIAIHPVEPGWLYVGTEVGIFTSENDGLTWQITNDGPANVSVDELVWNGSETLYAATHGRGIFKTSVNDIVPDAISFGSQMDVALSTELTTEPKLISGISSTVDVSISNGEYSIGCNGTFTTGLGMIVNGDTICLRHTSAAAYYTTVSTEVSIGRSNFTFNSRTIADITPDDYAFIPVLDVDPSAIQTSNTIAVTGISNQVNIIVINGEYSVDCQPNNFTSAAGIIQLNETVCVRHTSSNQNWQTATTQLTIGDVTEDFNSTTLPDTTPDVFSFAALTEVEISTTQTSESIRVTGIQVAVSISIDGGEYSIGCGSTFTNTTTEISPDETVCVRHLSSTNYVTQTTSNITIGGVSTDFISTTIPDRTPDNFSFVDVTNVELSTQQVSNSITITGIGEDVTVTVNGGEYSIGCGSTYSSAATMIAEGESICVRHTSSSSNSTAVQTSLTVGTVSENFSSTTKAAPQPESSSGGGSLGGLLLLMFGLFRFKLFFIGLDVDH